MVHENEVIMLIMGIGVQIFAASHRSRIKRIYAWRNFTACFYILLAAWVFTIAEGFFWGHLLNVLEHACYMASAIAMALWCFRLLVSHSKVVN